MIIGIFLLATCSVYYYNFAKKYNRKKITYALAGFILPVLPFILFALYMIIGHLILGHDPKGRIGKTFFTYGMISYIIFIFLLPHYLKTRWKEERISLELNEEILH